VVIVPDGLAAKDGAALPQPSFAFRAVLDAALARPASDSLILAPANAFGGSKTEEEVAEDYLRAHGWQGVLLRQPAVKDGYVDTRGNAFHLRRWLQARGMWPLSHAVLMVTTAHAARAELCFAKEGFAFESIVRIPYLLPPEEEVVPRLWYYRHPAFHRLYEAGAYMRDWIRP
jgi:uncharacterized SAM-binding protein YcdF (DUF218 family)